MIQGFRDSFVAGVILGTLFAYNSAAIAYKYMQNIQEGKD